MDNLKGIKKMLKPQFVKDLMKISQSSIDLKSFSKETPDFIKNFPELAQISNAKDFKYLSYNQKVYDFFGLDRLVGKTILDIKDEMKDKWTEEQKTFTDKMFLENENVVRYKKTIVVDNPKESLNSEGFVFNQITMKLPMFDSRNRVNAILTLSFDDTKSLTAENLYDRYQKIYKQKNNLKLGNKKFLDYIGLKSKNCEITSREITCLIVMSKYRTIKEAAKELNIESKTLSSHLYTIKLKLAWYDLSEILNHFRFSNLWKF